MHTGSFTGLTLYHTSLVNLPRNHFLQLMTCPFRTTLLRADNSVGSTVLVCRKFCLINGCSKQNWKASATLPQPDSELYSLLRTANSPWNSPSKQETSHFQVFLRTGSLKHTTNQRFMGRRGRHFWGSAKPRCLGHLPVGAQFQRSRSWPTE